jgi:hypothetical protein
MDCVVGAFVSGLKRNLRDAFLDVCRLTGEFMRAYVAERSVPDQQTGGQSRGPTHVGGEQLGKNGTVVRISTREANLKRRLRRTLNITGLFFGLHNRIVK